MKNILSFDEFVQKLGEDRFRELFNNYLREGFDDEFDLESENFLFDKEKSYTGEEIQRVLYEAVAKKAQEEETLPKGHIHQFLEAFIKL